MFKNMGTQLTAKRAGTCPECGNSWQVGEQIFWDRAVKNSAGGNVTCTSDECFKQHGGTITPFVPKGTTPSSGKSWSKPQLDLTFVIPAKVEDPELDKTVIALMQIIARADLAAGALYPNLTKTSDTFGMIRSKLADQLIAVGRKA